MDYRYCFPCVVEDDDNFALFLNRALRKAGVPQGNVRRYRDGEGALADLLSHRTLPPSVLLLDMELPGMSGLEVLERIRSRESLENLPAFILSSREDSDRVASAYALRAGGYWLKPQDLWELQEIVDGILKFLDRPGQARLPRCLRDPRTV